MSLDILTHKFISNHIPIDLHKANQIYRYSYCAQTNQELLVTSRKHDLLSKRKATANYCKRQTTSCTSMNY